MDMSPHSQHTHTQNIPVCTTNNNKRRNNTHEYAHFHTRGAAPIAQLVATCLKSTGVLGSIPPGTQIFRIAVFAVGGNKTTKPSKSNVLLDDIPPLFPVTTATPVGLQALGGITTTTTTNYAKRTAQVEATNSISKDVHSTTLSV